MSEAETQILQSQTPVADRMRRYRQAVGRFVRLYPTSAVSVVVLFIVLSAVVLVDVEGFSYKEIAEMTDVKVGTVMSRISRGRKALQRTLSE